MMKIFRLFVAFTLICFVLSPRAQAVAPPPDGGYPNKNTAEGDQALFSLTSGFDNTAIGYQALQNNTKGDHNTASGVWALRNNTAGSDNTASGAFALFNNTTGLFNTANGTQALTSNTTGMDNTATGEGALKHNTTGDGNTANGEEALVANTSGERNTAIGWHALEKNTIGSFDVALGAGAGSGVITANDVICIGRGVDGVNVSGTCFIGNIRGVQTQNANALPVVIDGTGQLGTVASSERFKKDIANMEKSSEALLALRPVTFHYKTDTKETPQFGLIAEEVAKVNPALVMPDKEGKPYTVRYDAVNAMLLNEFLKEHRKVDSLEKAMAEQQKENVAMRAMLKEQAAQIQKVSAQLEVSKPRTADGAEQLLKLVNQRKQ
jgi:Chaperone of endosialidase